MQKLKVNKTKDVIHIIAKIDVMIKSKFNGCLGGSIG